VLPGNPQSGSDPCSGSQLRINPTRRLRSDPAALPHSDPAMIRAIRCPVRNDRALHNRRTHSDPAPG